MNRRKIGTEHEKQAAAFLKEQGYTILCANYRCRAGEIDLIARDGAYLVFIEVKYRTDESVGSGMESVDGRKQKRIVRSALWYLSEKKISLDQPCRFDVVSILGSEITLIKDAFWCE